jgi:hypothetical protein
MATRDITQPKGAFGTAFWTILLILAIPLVALIVFKAVGQPGEVYDFKRAALRKERLQALREADQAQLSGTAWVDESKGIVRIPIEEAMQLTLVDLQNKPQRPSAVKPQKVQPPAQAAPAAPTASPAAAPAAAPAGSPAAAASPMAPAGGASAAPATGASPKPAEATH